LNQREKAVAIERVAANRQGVKNHNFKTDQAWQTVADPKTWILFILAVSAQVPNAAITSVSKTMTLSCLLRLINITVHISNHQGLRIRNSRLSISANSRWFCSVRCSHRRRLYLQQMAQLPLPHHDGSQPDLHCWSCNACRLAAKCHMGSLGCTMAVLLPGTRLQHELDHDQQ
jgi:hypothetical protein